jgi:hypothetical protein
MEGIKALALRPKPKLQLPYALELKGRTIVLGAEVLEIRDATVRRFAYSEITQVRLDILHRTVRGIQYRCRILLRNGEKLVIYNQRIQAPADEQNARYRRFVGILHRLLVKHQVPARTTAGSRSAFCLGLAFWILFGLQLIVLLVTRGHAPLVASTVSTLALGLAHGPVLRHPPRLYAADNIPADFVPPRQ